MIPFKFTDFLGRDEKPGMATTEKGAAVDVDGEIHKQKSAAG